MAIEKAYSPEYNSLLSFDSNLNATISTTYKRTGTYSFRSDQSGTEHNTILGMDVTARDEYYIQFAVYFIAATSTDRHLLRWKFGSVVLGGLDWKSDSSIEVFTGDFVTSLGSFAVSTGGFVVIEVRVKIADSGIVQVRRDGTLVVDYSGDTKPGTETQIDRFELHNPGYNQNTYYDDIVIFNTTGTKNNSWPNGVRLYVLRPSGAGDSTQWTASSGNNWDCLEELPPVQTDFIYPTADAQRDNYVFGDLPAEVKQVSGVVLDVWGQTVGSPAINKFKPTIRASSTDYDGSAKALTPSFAKNQCPYDDHPDTTAWTVTKVNDAKYGVVSST